MWILGDGRARSIDVVSTLYEPITDWQSWSETVIDCARKVFVSPAVGLQLLRLSREGLIASVDAFSVPRAFEGYRDAVMPVLPKLDRRTVRSYYFPPSNLVHMDEALGGASSRGQRSAASLLEGYSAASGLGLVAHPEPGLVACLFMMSTEAARLSPRERQTFTQLGLHLESSIRLHCRPETLVAVVGPRGRIEHLRDPDADRHRFQATAERLRDARREARTLGASALDLWSGLMSGQLTACPRRIGSREHVLFLENPPHRQPLQALTAAEQDALSMACRGHPAKAIAYGLGVAESTVSMRLQSAAAKVGLLNRLQLVRLAAMLTRDPRAGFTDTALTTAERDVLELLGQGLSNVEIARIRSRSVRTVANQVAALLRKTGAANRKSLAALGGAS